MSDHRRIHRIAIAVARSSRVVLASSLIILLLLCLFPNKGSAAPGDLDESFGSGGKVTTDFDGASDQANGIAIQSDER